MEQPPIIPAKPSYPHAVQKAARRGVQAMNGCKRVEVVLTASQSLKLDLLASEAGKPKATIIAGLIERAEGSPVQAGPNKRKLRDLWRWPPGMSSSDIESLINSVCGCAANYDCDCVSVFNEARTKAWTNHNQKAAELIEGAGE